MNYEDPPYDYPGDLIDVTDEVQKPQQKAANPHLRILIPRPGLIPVDLSGVRPGQPGDAIPVLIRAIQRHAGDGLPGQFRAALRGSTIFIEPTMARRKSGRWEAVESVLETRIVLDSEALTPYLQLKRILTAVEQKAGVKIGVGAIPLHAFGNPIFTFSATNELARDVILRLFETALRSIPSQSSADVQLSYRLGYDPTVRYYMFNVNVIRSGPDSAVPFPAAPASGSGVFGRVPKNPN